MLIKYHKHEKTKYDQEYKIGGWPKKMLHRYAAQEAT